ncbi:MAG: hypothetical protein D6734_00995, partial [Candidatus Schekmanbacteria bacterium]
RTATVRGVGSHRRDYLHDEPVPGDRGKIGPRRSFDEDRGFLFECTFWRGNNLPLALAEVAGFQADAHPAERQGSVVVVLLLPVEEDADERHCVPSLEMKKLAQF